LVTIEPPAGQRTRLVEDDAIDLGHALDRVARIEQHAGANRAPEATVCTAEWQGERAGQVIMSTAIAVTIESCQVAPRDRQPIMVRAAAVCTTGA